MGRTSVRILVVISGLLASLSATAREVREGLEVELTGDGLGLLAGMLQESIGSTLADVALPEVRSGIGGGVDVTLRDGRASLAIEALSLRPTAAGLALDVSVKDVVLRVPSMRFKWEALGATVSTTCKDTVLRVAESEPVRLKGVLGASVRDEVIDLEARELSFPVTFDSYRAEGPASCSGVWGLRDVTRLALSGVMKLLWPFVEKLVTDGIVQAVPQLEEQLNAQTRLSVLVDLKDTPPLPERTAELAAFPAAVTTTDDAFRIVVGFRIRRVEVESRRALEVEAAPGAVRLASAGLNPSLLSEAFTELFPDGTDWLELTDDLVPALSDVLKVRSLAGIWPDLHEAPLSGTRLRLFARLAAPPELWADGESQSVLTRFPHIELRFLAPIGEAWVDYFVVSLDLAAGLRPTAEGPELQLRLAPEYSVGIAGRWADGYVPSVELFEQDLFGVVIATLVDFTREAGPLARVNAPELEVGGRPVALTNPHVRAPYVRVDATGR